MYSNFKAFAELVQDNMENDILETYIHNRIMMEQPAWKNAVKRWHAKENGELFDDDWLENI